jgi:hypothetical protein
MTHQYIRSLSRLNLLMPGQITHEGFEMVWGTNLSIYHAPQVTLNSQGYLVTTQY